MKILFVCTGNVFRSLSAELLLKDYLKKQGIKGVAVASAGTIAEPDPLDPFVLSELLHYGVDASKHKQTRLTKEIAQSAELVIAMAIYHQRFIKENFGVDAPLFNEVCYGKSVSVWDVNDVMAENQNHRKAEEDYMRKTIKHIHNSMPSLVKKINSMK